MQGINNRPYRFLDAWKNSRDFMKITAKLLDLLRCPQGVILKAR
jgi:hypothetical protein